MVAQGFDEFGRRPALVRPRLNWTFAFNHDEAVACFRRAAEADPACAMARWGIAYATGPFYNRAWIRYSDAEIAEVLPVCHDAAEAARSLAGDATPAERTLIQRWRSGTGTGMRPTARS